MDLKCRKLENTRRRQMSPEMCGYPVTDRQKLAGATAANSKMSGRLEQGICSVSARHLSMCQRDTETCSNSALFIRLIGPLSLSPAHPLQVDCSQMTGAARQKINRHDFLHKQARHQQARRSSYNYDGVLFIIIINQQPMKRSRSRQNQIKTVQTNIT